MRRDAGRLARGALFHAFCLGVAVLFALPLFWVLTGSLRQAGLPPPRSVEWLPRPLAWENYGRLFELLPFARYALNSLVVTAVAVPLTLVTASWAGFAIAQLPARWRGGLVLFSIGLLMVPQTAVWLTRFVLFKWLGLINTYWALVAPAFMGSSPLFVLLFTWTFLRLPPEMLEAARLEGASALTLWRRLALPLAGPTVVAVGVLAFLLYWSDFIHPLLYLKSQELYTLPVALQQLQQLDRTNWPLLLAGAVLLAAPAVATFLLAQRYFLAESRLAGFSGT